MTISVHEQGQKNLYDGDINEERASRFFVVRSDTPITEVQAATATGVPPYFDPHPSNSSYLCKQKRGKSLAEEAGRYGWEIQADYSNKIILPLSMPAQYEWDFSEATEEYFFDCDIDYSHPNGYPVVNSAGQPFEQIPQREGGSITANCTKNVAVDFDVSAALSFRQTINKESFVVDGVTIDVDQAKISGMQISPPQLSNGQWYRVVKVVVKMRKDWQDHFADMGFAEIDDTWELQPILAGNPPQQVTKPWPLDGNGYAQSSPTDTPAKLDFKPYHEADFSALSALFV